MYNFWSAVYPFGSVSLLITDENIGLDKAILVKDFPAHFERGNAENADLFREEYAVSVL